MAREVIGDVPRPLATVAARLSHDLKTRFPAAEVVWLAMPDHGWSCEVSDGGVVWGQVSDDYFDDRDEYDGVELEKLVVHVAEQVVDNLWPDDDTGTWPRCPTHDNHPLQVQMAGGRASWVCLQDDATAVVIGALE